MPKLLHFAGRKNASHLYWNMASSVRTSESVCKSARDKELPVVFSGKFYGYMFARNVREPLRISTATSKTAPLITRTSLLWVYGGFLEMQSAQNSVRGFRLIILDENGFTHFFFQIRAGIDSKKYSRSSLKIRGSMITTPSMSVFITSIIPIPTH